MSTLFHEVLTLFKKKFVFLRERYLLNVVFLHHFLQQDLHFLHIFQLSTPK